MDLLLLPTLSVAAGLDLYLTLLFLGAASSTSLWPALPGALGGLGAPQIVVAVGALYVLEFVAERQPASALAWNAFHALIRPLSGALLALLLLDGRPGLIVVPSALLAGALASLVHGVRSGEAILRWLEGAASPHALLVSLLEDSVVLGLLALALDRPAWALGVTAALLLAAAPGAPSALRAFTFTVRTAAGFVFQTFGQRRWLGPDEIPAWVRRKLEGRSPLGGTRATPAGALRLPGAPRFTTGWVVARDDGPSFVFGAERAQREVDLETLALERVGERGVFRRLDLTGAHTSSRIFLRLDGPGGESLEAEFGARRSAV